MKSVKLLLNFSSKSTILMKQLDVDVSPPASIINLILGKMHWVAFACKGTGTEISTFGTVQKSSMSAKKGNLLQRGGGQRVRVKIIISVW